MLDAMEATATPDAAVVKRSISPPTVTSGGGGTSAPSIAVETQDRIKSSPPALMPKSKMDPHVPEDAGGKSDSEAETIVLPGKDGHSPSKTRKSIKHEDKSGDEEMHDVVEAGDPVTANGAVEGGRASEPTVATSSLGKRKRKFLKNGSSIEDSTAVGNSSGLSSVPTSPVATNRSSLSKPEPSDSDISRSPSPPSTVHDKAKSVDRVLPRRKQYGSASGDDSEAQRFNRHQSSSADLRQGKEGRLASAKHVEANRRKRTRSNSPPPRAHRRSVSTQLEKSSHGLSHKKRRVPAPLQSTEYQSDDSSASESSSHPRSARLRHLTTSAIGGSTISPAKMAPHKKNVNSSGQTFVARACAKGDLEMLKQKLQDRPNDLNVVDYAENTPLHSASLAGRTAIVQYLLDQGCTVDPVNMARDTPLHDAIENGHLEVVKLLLDAGANPRKANGKGEDPSDLVDEDLDQADELREAIKVAKQRTSEIRRSSEDDRTNDNSRLSRASPRQTPPIHGSDSAMGLFNRRTGTSRSIKTSERALHQNLNVEELRRAAGANEPETVVRVLQVLSTIDDPKSLILAAKSGSHDVINMLFAIGSFDPDPLPVESESAETETPILAAIGRDNLEVIELFLNQPNFDPTRIVRGEAYYEIARRRAGRFWKEEEALLKGAFDKYKNSSQASSHKSRSPAMRRDGREADRDHKRLIRREEPKSPQSHKRSATSPGAKDPEKMRSTSSKSDQNLTRRGPGRPRKEEGLATLSDHETSPEARPRNKRPDPDAPTASETEASVKPRRKLVSGKEIRGERDLERQRRASNVSSTSIASVREKREAENKGDRAAGKTSPNASRSKTSNHDERQPVSERSAMDKDTRSLNRDDSKDRLSAVRGSSPVKRPRKSETPPRSGAQEISGSHNRSGSPEKRRKLGNESKAGSPSSSSPENRTSTPRSGLSREETTSGPVAELKNKEKTVELNIKDVGSLDRSKLSQATTTVQKREAPISESGASKVASANEPNSEAKSAQKESEVRERHKAEQREAQAHAEKEALDARRKAELDEKAELERVEQATKARLERERAAQEEKIRGEQEEQERQERQRQEDADAAAREKERQRALYLEQEKQKREENERRRAQLQEHQRAEKIRLETEQERARLAKLPLLLRWLDQCKNPKTPEFASLFRFIEGYRYDTIRPEAEGLPEAREQWILNSEVALLLGEKDLQLSRYTAWERIPLSHAAKRDAWRILNPYYSLNQTTLWHLLKDVPEYPENRDARHDISKPLFMELDLFFVKVSEFMFVVPNFPHLRNIEIAVRYRELNESPGLLGTSKWKHDPDTAKQSFIPQPKYYLNGVFQRQGKIKTTRVSSTSFGEGRVPRRGLMQVFPHEHDYVDICKEQGLYWLLPGYQEPNGRMDNDTAQTNGITPPGSESKSVNGGSPA